MALEYVLLPPEADVSPPAVLPTVPLPMELPGGPYPPPPPPPGMTNPVGSMDPLTPDAAVAELPPPRGVPEPPPGLGSTPDLPDTPEEPLFEMEEPPLILLLPPLEEEPLE